MTALRILIVLFFFVSIWGSEGSSTTSGAFSKLLRFDSVFCFEISAHSSFLVRFARSFEVLMLKILGSPSWDIHYSRFHDISSPSPCSIQSNLAYNEVTSNTRITPVISDIHYKHMYVTHCYRQETL